MSAPLSQGRQPTAGFRPPLMVIAAVAGLTATVVVLAVPAVRFAYDSPELHIALETAATSAALLAALLFFGRVREHRMRSNWALVYALTLSALVNFGFAVLPLVAGTEQLAKFSQWSAAVGRLTTAGVFAYAAFSEAPLRRPRRLAASVVGATLGSGALLAVLTWLALPVLPAQPTQPGPAAATAATDHPLLLGIETLGLIAFTAAAVGFVRRAHRSDDELLRWLSAGALLGGVSRLHYLIYPSLYTQWVYSGDVLRLGFYAFLLVGAVEEIRRYWQRMAEALAEEERRRIARDLHDGLAQELAFISAQAHWLEHDTTPGTIRSVIGASNRALDESRRAIAALTRPVDEPFEVALAQAAEEVADRVGTAVKLELDSGADVDSESREALIRIAREAIANAGRHSGSDHVEVRLNANGRVRMQIHDAGSGFDLDQVRPDRFGLVSMRERAQALDADFHVRSVPGQGTTVEVALP